MTTGCELLTTAEMYAADQAAMDAGVTGVRLMENAGAAVAQAVMRQVPAGARVSVLCGPGNNGGDGFVAARHLRTAGYRARLALLGETGKLKGDAARHAAVWGGPVEALGADAVDGAEAVVDALFGAGLTRPLEGAPAEAVRALNARGVPVVAVDVPSGVSGDTGETVGDLAVHASETVSFFRAKPGHWLRPGRDHCGRVTLADIGIPADVLDSVQPNLWRNDPSVWAHAWPWRTGASHKYRHGHALVVGGPTATGAARLGARAAMRAGAGLVSVAAPEHAMGIYAGESPSLITAPLTSDGDLAALLADGRKNAVLIGPGAGTGQDTRERVRRIAEDGRACVLDADALTVFADSPDRLAGLMHERVVVTPHEGEFARLVPDLQGDKLTRARAAAARLGGVVVLKGADTVIAAPDGRAAIDANGPPELATAGTGDVLAGIVTGALAQGLAPFDAACAGVWLLGAAARGAGPGLISADIPERLPAALAALRT